MMVIILTFLTIVGCCLCTRPGFISAMDFTNHLIHELFLRKRTV